MEKNSVVAKFATTASDGKNYQVEHYNLDVIISLGYRVKSKEGTHFRQWATQRLKDYLIKGYAVNQQRLSQLQQSFKLIREAALSEDFSKSQVREIIDILSDYAMGLDILDGYDKQNLELGKVDRNPVFQISYSEAKLAIEELRIKFGGSPLFSAYSKLPTDTALLYTATDHCKMKLTSPSSHASSPDPHPVAG